MSNIKYTTDGRKVAIVGKLNNQETIVQEIFISGGNEIPAGENFVVRSLLDAPAESWKEAELKRFEALYKKEKESFSKEIDRLSDSYRKQCYLLRGKLQFIAGALKNADESSFTLLVDYICGNITHIVVQHNGDIDLCPMDEFNELYEDKLRLISFFGKNDGSFTYAVGDYYDYSGGNKRFIPCRSLADAIAATKAAALAYGVSEKTLSLAKKHGFQFPANDVEEYKKKQIDGIEKNIGCDEANIAKHRAEIEKIKSL